jgi:hypothetical protein
MSDGFRATATAQMGRRVFRVTATGRSHNEAVRNARAAVMAQVVQYATTAGAPRNPSKASDPSDTDVDGVVADGSHDAHPSDTNESGDCASQFVAADEGETDPSSDAEGRPQP